MRKSFKSSTKLKRLDKGRSKLRYTQIVFGLFVLLIGAMFIVFRAAIHRVLSRFDKAFPFFFDRQKIEQAEYTYDLKIFILALLLIVCGIALMATALSE
jgi:uncharacterized membrane protein